jgi:biopolymer transport protein ExbD
MNQGFSVSFLGLSLTLLLWFCVVHGPRCSSGLPELPITDNLENFGYVNQHQYPILTIKADGNKFFENDWLPDINVLSSNSSIQNSDFVLIRADARLPFGEVRKTLEELKKYRSQGIVLMAERKIVEPKEISPFEEYIWNRSRYCGC